jgi:hypothetical protein
MLQNTEIVEGFKLEIDDFLSVGGSGVHLDDLLSNESLRGVEFLRNCSDIFLQLWSG